jgi:hypothetical protein
MENRGRYLSELRRSGAAGLFDESVSRSQANKLAIEEGLEDYSMSLIYPDDEDEFYGDEFDDLDPYDTDPGGLDDIERYDEDPYEPSEDYLTIGGDSDLLNER